MDPASIESKLTAAPRPSQRPKTLTAILSYGLTGGGVALALAVGVLFRQLHFSHTEIPLLLFAVAVPAWYAGPGAAAVAWLLSCIGFDYFFVEPLYSLEIAPSDIPRITVFALFAALVTWFSTVRRRVERELLQTRDDLEKRGAELQASNNELEAFAYSVSHDLRAPLRHMAGFSELLQKNSASVLDDKSKRYIG